MGNNSKIAGSIVLIAFSAALPAQSPCSPPARFATVDPFQSTVYFSAPGQVVTCSGAGAIAQNLPSGYRGFMALFDLAVSADVTISQIDLQLLDDGIVNWGPTAQTHGGTGLVGQTVVMNVFVCPNTWIGNYPPSPPGGPAPPWTLAGTGTLTVQDHASHSPAVFPTPFTLLAG